MSDMSDTQIGYSKLGNSLVISLKKENPGHVIQVKRAFINFIPPCLFKY